MKFLTKRQITKNEDNKKKHCFDIIFEWENIICDEINCELVTRSVAEFKFDAWCRNIYAKSGIPVFRLFRIVDLFRDKNIFMFDARFKEQDGIYNSYNYIPIIIDFFADKEQYIDFVKAYKNNRMVIVTSKEVYDYLINKTLPFDIEFFPLSLPDYYKIEEKYEKKYDVIIAGRLNPLLEGYMVEYEKKYKDISVLRRKYENGHFKYYISSTGEVVCNGDTRDEYTKLLRESKVAFYSTPGMDGTRTDANGWNQVTPRFLEEVSAQCHIIARYPQNSDTDWYKMDKICHSIQSYNDFEDTMNKYLSTDVDIELYKEYINNNITSSRICILKDIILKYNL